MQVKQHIEHPIYISNCSHCSYCARFIRKIFKRENQSALQSVPKRTSLRTTTKSKKKISIVTKKKLIF